MNPAERFALLKGLEAAVKAELETARCEALDYAHSTGAAAFNTPAGRLSIATPKPRPTVTDERALLAWLRTNHPDLVVESIDPTGRKALLEAAEVVGDDAVDASTGEVLPGVTVRQGDPYPTARLDRQWKATACQALSTGLERLLPKGLP